jgi:hypothetical protein
MRRPGRVLVTVCALTLAAACSRHDDAKVKSDLRGAGHDVTSAASDVSHNADVKRAEAQLRTAGHDAAKDLRKAAAEAKAAAHSLAADGRHAAHGATRPTSRDQHDSSS